MAKFTFNLIYRDKNGEFVDDENVWVRADNKLEALAKVKSEYPKASSYTLNIVCIIQLFYEMEESLNILA